MKFKNYFNDVGKASMKIVISIIGVFVFLAIVLFFMDMNYDNKQEGLRADIGAQQNVI